MSCDVKTLVAGLAAQGYFDLSNYDTLLSMAGALAQAIALDKDRK